MPICIAKYCLMCAVVHVAGICIAVAAWALLCLLDAHVYSLRSLAHTSTGVYFTLPILMCWACPDSWFEGGACPKLNIKAVAVTAVFCSSPKAYGPRCLFVKSHLVAVINITQNCTALGICNVQHICFSQCDHTECCARSWLTLLTAWLHVHESKAQNPMKFKNLGRRSTDDAESNLQTIS